MSLALIRSRALAGLAAPPVTVEVHLANGLPAFTLVGLADTEVKEARERVRAALAHSGLEFPHNRRITINLAPADLPKDSGRFDLPMAIGILAAMGHIDPTRLDGLEFVGELSLGGELRPVRGALAMALALARPASGADGSPGATLVLPADSAAEASLVEGVRWWPVAHLRDLVALLSGPGPWPVHTGRSPQAVAPGEVHGDLLDVRGQGAAKRALEIVAAGGHGLLMSGPPGTGKSMLARRLATLLPPLPPDEALESAAVLSLAGVFQPQAWGRRVVRAPHHSASAAALVGGGSPPRPGEISLAHRGVLFLDELPEFPRSALEALREPLETGQITISRAARRHDFPAQFQLVAAMNPCPCGHLGNPLRACRCTPDQIQRYQARLSGPLLDRIDLQIEVPVVAPDVLAGLPQGESSAVVAVRVARARQVQFDRQGVLNAQLSGQQLDRHVRADHASLMLLTSAATRLGWSARAFHRVLRLARTVADLKSQPDVGLPEVAEAIQYHRVMRPG